MSAALAFTADDMTGDFIQNIKNLYKHQRIVLVTEQDYADMAKARRNAEYLAMLDRSFKELEEGKVVVKTMEELEAMENG